MVAMVKGNIRTLAMVTEAMSATPPMPVANSSAKATWPGVLQRPPVMPSAIRSDTPLSLARAPKPDMAAKSPIPGAWTQCFMPWRK